MLSFHELVLALREAAVKSRRFLEPLSDPFNPQIGKILKPFPDVPSEERRRREIALKFKALTDGILGR